jgi:signal transduction histidine kinase
MLKKLGKTITIANAIAFTIVILVGGVSIFLTQDILHNAYKIEKLSRDIVVVDSIHADTYRLILAIHHFLIEPDELYSDEVRELIADLKNKVEDYKEDELGEIATKEGNMEIQLLDIILEDVKGLDGVSELMYEFSQTGHLDRDKLIRLEAFGYELEDTTKRINKIHFDKIGEWTDESLTNMWMILFIYLVFITLGGLTIYEGHRVLLKKVVRPIKDLAAATIEFAEGKLNKRVATDSQTEIGQLYQSFNTMAERLQENDEILRKFNEALEKKVKERTIELQKANVQLQKTQNALIRTEKVAAVGQIAAGVTHEIKNPLNSLSINAQMLLKELSAKFGADSPSYESAALIRYEINRINNILEEFVKFAKFPEPQFFENDMNQVISEVADLISHSAQDSGISIKLSLSDDLHPFKFDARQIKVVLMNLAQNAIKAMKSGGFLEIKTSCSDDSIIITVSDTGEGIAEKNLEVIFSPFFSTKEGGLGLGLSIVQRVVESHGGKIQCTSTVGSGTVFEITLPMERG